LLYLFIFIPNKKEGDKDFFFKSVHRTQGRDTYLRGLLTRSITNQGFNHSDWNLSLRPET